APAVPIQGPAADTLTNGNVTITGRATDTLSGIATLQAQVDGGAFGDVAFDAAGNYHFATTLPLTGSADGTHTVGLRATDQAGNATGFSTVTFTLDVTSPLVVITSPDDGATTRSNVTVLGRVTDSLSGVATLQVQIDVGSFTNVAFDGTGNYRFATTLPTDG